ncbi:sensor histidine kinase [Novosphingobium lentum]|uniref:sensor histidine kinase n=1 Tax=Novosphingobium lentum TaxID=145287 RepID=UPI0008295B35|nr:ATP-binding protein [Novosphingobium lentum]
MAQPPTVPGASPPAGSRPRFWPRSLQGQILLAIALALLVAQGLSAALIWRAQHERREAALVSSAAFRLLGGDKPDGDGPNPDRPNSDRPDSDRDAQPAPAADAPPPPPHAGVRDDDRPRFMRVQIEPVSPAQPGERHLSGVEAALAQVLADQGVRAGAVVVVERAPLADRFARAWIARHHRRLVGVDHPMPDRVVIAGYQRTDGQWVSARVFAPGGERQFFRSLLLQTLLLYAVLFGAVALILRHIARPLAALTVRVEQFARARNADGQLEPTGPDDIRRLITAHNAMEGRIAALLDEKDVMLGAIGHDLKTPLAALRVRIEAVDDDAERGKMAAGIEDINRSLDDILSLARVGRPSDPLETTELSALVGAVVEEFEDMGEDVTLGDTQRIVLPLRATWLRRAMRNLVSNALRYGQRARVTLQREGKAAVLRIEDDGPGIPEADVARMLEPFTRMEPSRNSVTGGSGLGLTLARAIAEQHGGSLQLANRRNADGSVAGLVATLRLPLN